MPTQGGVHQPFAADADHFQPLLAHACGRRFGLSLGVEAVAASRYEVRGVLFGSGANGELLPAAVGHAAAWLEPGHGTVELRFDQALVDDSGLRAPFEIRDLRLIDQGTMGLLHRQARGLVLDK